MTKIKILTAVAIAGLMLGGCAELKLPELPKVQKQENEKHKLTDEECKIILEKFRKAEVSTSDSYKRLEYDAHDCQIRSNGADIDIEKIMEMNK
ncbi:MULTISPECIES: hypothetical protein [Campylobacter]|uniref:Lipoprotein n=1 Tax=Campylobacter hyointestinalis subsp. hyointestinalis TaxID=91352 RepID=A0A855N8P5_CAMHY|nr:MULTISPECIES: hypothetical protein [Campylobacter]AVK81276.1 hypothetical protein C6B32_05375 [Campylobacter fetus subsp. testudinum]PPB55949.1 hypothetical protein CDQ70_09130 [Campylobacter hyointestinalis subsp. hyointestinalis]PPB70052.1 hypothetical protein CDQ78_09260 [Campylobacter hyointestinalis subsp. hyointestinalis]TWO22958.1 hypothetical protein YZ80_01580 [Campylobacter hyointestinalis]CUU74873.1 Uncharacterised protein [Campylobacter hyointestinalis subsp. hyointestinalis]